MACKINWTNRAWLTYTANIEYLKQEWTEKEISNFVKVVDKKINLLMQNPRLGSQRSPSQPNIRCTLVHKRVLLIYKYKPTHKEIDLLVFWNTYQNPRRINVK